MPIVRDPVYQQLNQLLRTLMADGTVSEGEQFLTEREVSQRFGVSRATANKALSNLVAEGILEFRKGVGTFVRGGILDYDLRTLVSFTEKAAAAGKKPGTRVLRFVKLAASNAPVDVARRLRCPPEEELLFVERLRTVDGKPVILERRHIVSRYCPGLRAADLSGSLYGIWNDRFGLTIAGAEQSIRAINLVAADARLLDLPRRAAALLVVATGVLSSGDPLWHEQTLYRADAYEFHTTLGGIRTARPAIGRFANLSNGVSTTPDAE